MEELFEENNSSYKVELTASKKQESRTANEGHLTVDVYQTDDEIVVQSTIAGTKSEDLDIQVTTDMVTIKGRRDRDEGVKPSDYFHRELYWGPFSRAIILPVDIDADSAKASYKNGILTIRLPKLEKLRTKKLKISE
ncbi:MAG TPA: Hsp20/alpha crystallin family protein [Candidatus Paceibacterota bacterium]|nr:Hsp20/alpha crystallin family protein [Candidatus Paceibacterota bacterium]